MHRLKEILVVLALSCGVLQAATPQLQVIYPKSGQQLGAADSSFIFGNVTPGSQLTINGFDVPVHPAGGWLAFLPLQPGEFEFEVVAVLEGDTNSISLPVRVPEPYRVLRRDSLVIVAGYRVPA
ncbi:MAG: hypothetical protein ABIJ61_06520, partial [bacterium]